MLLGLLISGVALGQTTLEWMVLSFKAEDGVTVERVMQSTAPRKVGVSTDEDRGQHDILCEPTRATKRKPATVRCHAVDAAGARTDLDTELAQRVVAKLPAR